MLPPVRVTGVPAVDWSVFIAGFVLCLYWLRALRLAREGARLFIRNLLWAVIVFRFLKAAMNIIRPQTHWSPVQEEIVAGFAALILWPL